MTDITLPLHNVHIQRGRDILTVEVPKHEIRVLVACHGSHNVRDQGEAEVEGTFDADAGAEIERMRRKYRRVNAPDPVAAAYPMGAESLASAGFKETGKAAKVAPQASVKDRRKKVEKKAPAKKD